MKEVYTKCNNSNLKKIVRYLQHKGYVTFFSPEDFIDICELNHATYIYGGSDRYIRYATHKCDCNAEDISYIFNSNATIF